MPKLLKDSPILKTDAYKVSHQILYPKGTSMVYSVLIPRANEYFPYSDKQVVFGYQLYVKRNLIEDWNKNFFDQKLEDVIYTWKTVIGSLMGPDTLNKTLQSIIDLHKLGYLPIEVKALPEGELVPMNVPVLTIKNTKPEFYWLASFLETTILADTFVPANTATMAHIYRKKAFDWAKRAGVKDTTYIDYQFHDFSERGQHGDSGVLSGLGHLTSFKGTDIVQAPIYAQTYYGGKGKDIVENPGYLGASVVASEHSVMETFGLDQYVTYHELLKNNPNGILSLVSDTYDYWEVVEDVLPKLKDEVLARNGKLVVRPDSLSDVPVELVRTLESLWNTFGGTTNDKGYKVLDSHVGVIFGEGTTLANVDKIMNTILDAKFSPENLVIGIGAYQYSVLNTRDTFSEAMKAQVAVVNGKEILTYKKPFDKYYPKNKEDKLKTSLIGGVVDVKDENGNIKVIDNLTLEQVDNHKDNIMHTIFKDGKEKNFISFTDIREKLQKEIK